MEKKKYSAKKLLQIFSIIPEVKAYLLSDKIPVNDYEYITMKLCKLKIIDMFDSSLPDFTKTLLSQSEMNIDNANDKTMLIEDLMHEVNTIIRRKIKKIRFKPKICEYINKSHINQKNEAEDMILALMNNISNTSNKLLDIVNNYNIKEEFVLKINEEHPFVKDKLIRFEKVLYKDDPLFYKYLAFNFSIYKLFIGEKLTDDDIIELSGSKLIEMFNLADKEFTEIMKHKEIEKKKEEIVPEGGLDQIEEIEKMFNEEKGIKDENAFNEEENDELENEEILNNTQLKAYKDDLDYLYGEFKWISAKMKYQLATKDSYDKSEKKINKALKIYEIEKQKSNIRLHITMKKFTPKLISLFNKIHLNEFEKEVLKVLICLRVFLLSGDEFKYSDVSEISVADLMYLLLDNEKEFFSYRKYFMKKSKLVKYNLIYSENRYNKQFYDIKIRVDERLVEFATGKSFDINNFIEGGNLYKSGIKFNNVILPDEMKYRLKTAVKYFPGFLKEKKKIKSEEISEYGNALVMLFIGPSGTGKTMLANALSNYLDKKILIFNFKKLKDISEFERETFSILFREARINDAILFFDEAEVIIQNRVTDILTEIEKHEGIVIFATNASLTIDEALRRRINLVMKFENPGPYHRKKIWKVHIPKSLDLANNIDFDHIAKKYELNGGFIKNAVYSTISYAVADSERKGLKKTKIKMEHLEKGAKEQLGNKLFYKDITETIKARKGIESLIVKEDVNNAIHEIINAEKAKNVMISEWDMDSIFNYGMGTIVLFHGPSGTGKTYAAECISYEAGKRLKIVNYPHIISKWVGETETILSNLFKEAKEDDSILVFDEADTMFTQRTVVSSSTDRYANAVTNVLLKEMERYNGVIILISNLLENIDKAFMRRISYIVEFKKPEYQLRRKLWKVLIPEKLPVKLNKNDINKLAKNYDFTGGDIKTVVLRIARKAAITMNPNKRIPISEFIKIADEIIAHKREGKIIGFNK